MKMLTMICSRARVDEVRALIVGHAVRAYSEIEDVAGEGATGKRLGTHVWPDRSVLLFSVLADDKCAELLGALRAFQKQLLPGEGLKAFTVPVEQEL